MGQLAQLILDNLYKLWPVRVIDVDCQGVRFFGKKTEVLQPGFHWFIPGLMRIEKYAVRYQEIDCEIQTVETADGISVSFSANGGYTISDAMLMRTEVHDFDTQLGNAIRGHLESAVSSNTYENLRRKRKQIAAKTRRAIAREIEPWGVKLVRVRWTDFTRAPAQRIMGALAQVNQINSKE